MTKEKINKIREVATEVANYMGDVYGIDEIIEKLEDYELNERVSFTTEICVWEAGEISAKDRICLNSFLSSYDQKPLRMAIIDLLKEQREEYISDFKKATVSLEKLAKEVLNE